MNFLSLFTPINLLEEKERFFASDSYNPKFKYNRNVSEISDYLFRHPSKRVFVEALESGRPEIITAVAKTYFQTDIDSNSLKAAEVVLSKGFSGLDTIANSADKVKDEMEKALKYFEIDYKVEISDRHGFNVRPSHKNKIISVSKYIQLGLFSIEVTVKHELVHVIRYINKEYNQSKKSFGNLAIEEGFASYIGDYKSKDGMNSLFHHAAEYKAIETGLKGSLRDIFNFFIVLDYPDDFAWSRSIRHKFGFTDTSKPGDIIKPGMYFYFENIIKDLPKEEIIKLFSGKLSLDALRDISEYSGIIPKSKLIEYFNL